MTLVYSTSLNVFLGLFWYFLKKIPDVWSRTNTFFGHESFILVIHESHTTVVLNLFKATDYFNVKTKFSWTFSNVIHF